MAEDKTPAKPSAETPKKAAAKPKKPAPARKAKSEADKAEPKVANAPVPAPATETAKADTPATPQPQRSSVVPMVIAGVIVAGLGFAAGQADLIWPAGQDESAALQEQISGLETKLAAVEQSLPAPVDLGPIDATLSDIGERVAKLEAALAAPADTDPAALLQLQTQLEAQQARMADQQAKIDVMLANAQTAAATAQASQRSALASAALNDLTIALSEGRPFAAELSRFAQQSDAAIPPALSDVAADGVASLPSLQGSIASAARDALAAARASDSEGATSIGGFLARQLGARSVTPREGDDPDAVLSRVEAATRAGDLTTALAEAKSLPEPARAAMADWLMATTARADALGAAQALGQTLDTQ